MLSFEWLSAFVPIGALRRDQWHAAGAGVLFAHQETIWVVTANHVVEQIGEDRATVLFSLSGGGVTAVNLAQIHRDNGLSWVREPNTDLACAIVPVSDQVRMKAVAEDNCLSIEQLVPSMQCYTVGCPYGVRGVDSASATPLVLDGVVSGTNASLGVVHTSAPTFPGNSGGPLIVVRSPFNAEGNMVVGRATVLLAGIVLQSALVRSPNPDDHLPPLHLGMARAVGSAWALLKSRNATQQIDMIRLRDAQRP